MSLALPPLTWTARVCASPNAAAAMRACRDCGPARAAVRAAACHAPVTERGPVLRNACCKLSSAETAGTGPALLSQAAGSSGHAVALASSADAGSGVALVRPALLPRELVRGSPPTPLSSVLRL